MKHKLTRYICAALVGFTLACTVSFNSARADTTNTIVLTDFDNSPSYTWGYGYDYSWGGTQPAPAGHQWVYVPLYTNETVVSYGFWFTNTEDEAFVGAGGFYGLGFGGPGFNTADWDGFSLSTRLEDYIFSFDARADGLLPSPGAAGCEMQAQWQGPSDPYGTGKGNNVYQLNFKVNVPAAWTHYSFLLSDYTGVGGWGSLSNWMYCATNVNDLGNPLLTGMQWNVDMYKPDTGFGFDADNAVFIDNVQLQQIIRTAPVINYPSTFQGNIFEWNMDDKPLSATWGGDHWSANSALPNYTYSTNAAEMAGTGVGGSGGFWLQMDNSALAAPNTPDWAGGQNGCTGPANYSLFTDNILKHYVFEVDAKADGLADGITDTSVDCQLFLDSAVGGVGLYFSVPANSNWVHSTFSFDNIGNWGNNTAGAKATFATNYNTINGVHVQWQMNNANNGTMWGFDTDNRITVDNMKLVHYATACPALTINTYDTDEVVTWAAPDVGTAQLQSATSVSGPWNDVVGATSPHTNSISSAPIYFRTHWVPPP